MSFFSPARRLACCLPILLLPVAALGASDPGALRELLDDPARPEADRSRDADRKPVEVIEFLGVKPGMTVVDVIAASGYYTEVLAHAVGPEGRVIAQNPPIVLEFREGANDKAMTARLAQDRLPNVMRLDQDFRELSLEEGSVDVALTALNFHDLYNRDPEVALGVLQIVKGFLKPGGVLGLIDHAGDPDQDNVELHRIEEAKVRAAVKQAGFEIDGDSDLLRNPADDKTQNVFAEGLRGKTDRFVLRLRKPQTPVGAR